MTPSSGGGRPRDAEVDRRIAEAALKVFGDVGWAGFAIETVARVAGVGKASVYLRWNSKEELLASAVSLQLSGVSDADTGSLHGDIAHLARQAIEGYSGWKGKATLRLSLDMAAVPGLGEHYDGIRRSQMSAARAIVRRGIARGELSPSVPVDLLLNALFGSVMMQMLVATPSGRTALAASSVGQSVRISAFLLDGVVNGAVAPRNTAGFELRTQTLDLS